MRPSRLTFLAVCLVLFVWVGSGCDPVSPPDHVRTPHDFTWTRDTLGDGSFQMAPDGIWGLSERDVYLVGFSSDFGRWKMWRFDGVKWNDITSAYFETFPGPPWYSYVPFALTGFASGDVWVAGRYDSTETRGEAMRGFALHRKPNGAWEGFRIPGALILSAIGGNSTDDLWVGGQYGQTFHYNGSSWTPYQIADSAMIVFIKAAPDGTVYASGWGKEGSGIEVQYFRWSGTQWEKIEERMSLNSGLGPEAGITFDILNDGSIFSATGSYIGRRVAQGSWVTLLSDPEAIFHFSTNAGPFAFALGRTKDDRELVYLLAHGDWKRVSAVSATNSRIFRVWSSATTTFLVAQENSPSGTTFPKTVIIRGK